MSITITEKDVGRTVRLRDGQQLQIEGFKEDFRYPVRGLTESWTINGNYLNTDEETGFDIIAFADEPAAPALTEDRVREIVREMMQPQKKESLRGECWVNVYAPGSVSGHADKGLAAAHAKHFGLKPIACVKVEWIEGQGLEGESR